MNFPLISCVGMDHQLKIVFFLRNRVDYIMKHSTYSTSPFCIKDLTEIRNYIEVQNILCSDEQIRLPRPEPNPPVAIARASKAFGLPQDPAPQARWDASSTSERTSASSAP